ncbi:MAG: DNA recombination protein RmuC [Prevotella sp.]|nr:DNA recombination protein RmuC [Prevotella sp.]
MEAIYIIIGVLAGGVTAFFLANRKRRETEVELVECKLRLERANTQLETERSQAQNEQTMLTAQHEKELSSLAERYEKEIELLKEQNGKEAQLRQEQFAEQLKTVQEQFSNLANKVLEQTSDRLKTQNTESMKTITAPLQQNIEQLQKAIQNTNSETAKSTASLAQQLKEMAEQTTRINTTATRLTNVIRGGNKAQGNWGERMLTEILEAQGFRVGFDYDVQQVIAEDDGGKRLIPDVVLHYPNNEDVVIDSKMSIEAYYLYVNTEDQNQRKYYAQELVRSIRTQMVNLSRKDYGSYVKKPRRAIDFVIMFVPNDGALQLALATEPRLWSEAFEKQVLITGQQNLMAILKIIQIAWRQYAQTENQKHVYGLAEELLKRIGEFIKRFDKVGKDIESLHKDYDDAYNKAYTGRQSIVQKANELKELGVKESANQPIPLTEAELHSE